MIVGSYFARPFIRKMITEAGKKIYLLFILVI